MKRALTGIAAAAVVLGTAAPMAFAATSTGLTKAGTLPIVVNGSVLSNPYEMTGKDSGNTTAFFPVYYFNQALSKVGYTATWDGVTHTWAITAPGVDASSISIAGGVGTGNTSITVNGTVVKKINTKAAKDPAASKSAAATTYLPVFYIDEILNAIGAKGSFSGQTGLSITGASTSTGASLSMPTVTGEAAGSATETSPAVSNNGGALTLSTTLTDSNGNPIANTNLTLTITGGSVPPTVEQNSTYETVSNPSANTYTANVTTNASGVASFAVTGVGAYTVEIDAPYTTNGSTVSKDAYIGFVNGSTPLISPSSVVGSPYAATTSTTADPTQGLVPVTVTLPLDSNNNPQANVPVQFTVSSSATPDGAFLATSSGANLGTNSYSTETDANGQATIYVNSYSNDSASSYGKVAITVNNGTTYDAYVQWAPASTTSTLTSIGAYAFGSQVDGTTSAAQTSVSGFPNDSEAVFAPYSSSELLMGSAAAQQGNANETYTLSASNGASIYSINGTKLSTINSALSGLSTVQLGVTYDSGSEYTLTVDGLTLGTSTNPYFSVALDQNSGTETSSTLTVSSGSVSATAAYTFNGLGQSYASSVTPPVSTISAGGDQKITLNVVDANGNPVADQNATIAFDGNETGAWVTSVNGVSLTEGIGTSGASEPTPIPLFTPTTSTPDYSSVFVSGVVNWTGGNTFTVPTDGNGQVSLTIQNGSVPYYAKLSGGDAVQGSGETAKSGTTTDIYTFKGTSNASTDGVVDIVTAAAGTPAPQSDDTNKITGTVVGQINWK